MTGLPWRKSKGNSLNRKEKNKKETWHIGRWKEPGKQKHE